MGCQTTAIAPRPAGWRRPMIAASLVGKLIAAVLFRDHPWGAAACFFGPDLCLFYHVLRPSAQGLGWVATRFRTERPEVWLTIDDGPDPADTPALLDLLDRHGARATFFVIGERAARHPALLAEIVRRGHEVAHHTQTHPIASFWCASPARLGRELDEALATLRLAGIRPRWFRPPVGIKNFFLYPALAARGLLCAGWSLRSGDGVRRDPDRVVAGVLRRLRPGAIILMHEGPWVHRRVRVRAIADLLDGLKARGYVCVLPPLDALE